MSEWEDGQRWVDMQDYYEGEAARARHLEECEGCEECGEPPEPCGWCGEVGCSDPECAQLDADLEALRVARPPACGWCWHGVTVGHRLAHEGEACAHPDHGRRVVVR